MAPKKAPVLIGRVLRPSRVLGKNNWPPIEEGMILWTPDCGNVDPANDLAGVTLHSPPASSPEPMQRRHPSGRQRSGRYANPNEFDDRHQGNLSYAQASVSRIPKTHPMQQYGVYSDERSNGYPSANQQQASGNENARQTQNQSRGPWSHGNQEGTFHLPSLPYAAVSVSNGQPVTYHAGEPLHTIPHQQYSATQQNGSQNQHGYAALGHGNSNNEPLPEEQQVIQAGSESRDANGEPSAVSVHEMNEQSMGMMHGGIDMDFQMADPSTQSAASMS